jgi:hypothetical protein
LPARIVEFCGEKALMMPYVNSLSDTQWSQPEYVNAIQEALSKLAKAGYEHGDLNRRHVGVYKIGTELKAVLFDLAVMSLVQPTEVDVAIKAMKEKLKL